MMTIVWLAVAFVLGMTVGFLAGILAIAMVHRKDEEAR